MNGPFEPVHPVSQRPPLTEARRVFITPVLGRSLGRSVGWLVGWWSLDTSSQRCSSHRGQRWTTSLFQILERTIRLWKYQLTVGYWLSLTIFPTDSIWCEACMDCLPWYMPAQFWLTGKSCMPHIVPRRDKCERDQLTYCFAIYASNGNLRLLGRLRFVIYWPKTVQFRKVHTNMQCFFAFFQKYMQQGSQWSSIQLFAS